MIIKTLQKQAFGAWFVTVDGKVDPMIPPQWTEGQAEGRAIVNYPNHRIITTSDEDHACNDHR